MNDNYGSGRRRSSVPLLVRKTSEKGAAATAGGESVVWRRRAYMGRANRRARWASFYSWPRAIVATAGLGAVVLKMKKIISTVERWSAKKLGSLKYFMWSKTRRAFCTWSKRIPGYILLHQQETRWFNVSLS